MPRNSSSEEEEEFTDEEIVVKKRKSLPKKQISKGKSKKSSKKRKHGSDEESGSDNSSSDSESSESGSSSNEADSDDEPIIKKERSSSKVNGISARTASSSSSASREHKIVRVKKETGAKDRMEEARKAFKWWEAPDLPEGINWNTLEHAGVIFAPDHVRHNIPVLYDGVPVELNAEQEELATFYASIPDDGPQLGNPKTREVFQKNFFIDFKASLPSGHVIQKFSKCDFSLIKRHLDLQKSLKKAATDQEKSLRKELKDTQFLRHGYALIDGRMEKVGNYFVEPPGLFRGRGEHPKTGALKKRCFAESISINLSEEAPVPICGIPGHAWQSVRHDPSVTWLCKWEENVMGQTKYVMLSASSSFKGKSDMDKYEKARRLKSHINHIRRDYTEKIRSKNREDRQLGTAMWVIDVLALRVGGEKGEDEADTVGCCSLRVEHLSFGDASDASNFDIQLEFLGKDSMLYRQNINFAQYGDLGKLVYGCLKSFCAGKAATADVFETLDPSILNKHLNSLMPGLSAKVFRTFNASVTLEKELPLDKDIEALSVQEKMGLFNAANRQVAILCNHQKTVSKAAEQMFENLNERLDIMKKQLSDLVKWKEYCRKGREDDVPLKKDDKDVVDSLANALKVALQKKEVAVSTEDKLKAGQAIEDAKNAQRQDARRRLVEKHMYKSCPSTASVESRIEKWNADLRKLELDIRNRDENKEVALGTSKINYIDPRICVAWCKRCEVPIDKVFAKTLRDKFNWAMAAGPDYKF